MTKLIGNSEKFQVIRKQIEKFSQNGLPVFITGETGTGKGLCAEQIHKNSNRAKAPFITLNCACLSENFIESDLFGHIKGAYTGADHPRDGAIRRAHGGTLFLDEITELPLPLQAKLLQFCQDYTYKKLGSDTHLKADIRLLCASNLNIKKQIHKKLFREDLYYRLCVGQIHLPSLRARPKDIIDLAQYFLQKTKKTPNHLPKAFSENALQAMTAYQWPGNIRELENIVQLLNEVSEQTINTHHLPKHIQKNIFDTPRPIQKEVILPQMPLWRIEKHAIENAIRMASNNIPHAAFILGIAPSTIYRKIKSWKSDK